MAITAELVGQIGGGGLRVWRFTPRVGVEYHLPPTSEGYYIEAETTTNKTLIVYTSIYAITNTHQKALSIRTADTRGWYNELPTNGVKLKFENSDTYNIWELTPVTQSEGSLALV